MMGRGADIDAPLEYDVEYHGPLELPITNKNKEVLELLVCRGAGIWRKLNGF